MILHRRSVLQAGAALALAGPAAAQAPAPGPFAFRAADGRAVDAEWGAFEVPEDRTEPGSRRITLRYVRFKSTAARPGSPLVYLAGGPGGSGVATARGPRFPIFMALREVGDVIAFDQRGTGASNAIPRCPPSDAPMPPLTREALTAAMRAEIQRCWRNWTEQGVAIGGYDTVQSAADLEDLRRHLGAERLNLWGISYGSHLALAALRAQPDRIERVALASLEGLDQTVKRPARIDGYLDGVDALIAKDASLRAAVPDLPALMRRVHARLEADPAALAVGSPPQTVRVGGFALQIIAGGLIKNPNTLALLPRLYSQVDKGRLQGLAPFLGQFLGPAVSGMSEAMDLASGVSAQRLAQVRREARTAVLGDALNFPMPHLLGAVPGVDLGEAFRRPFRSRVPALLIAGGLDGRTPLAEQAEVAAQFDRKAQVLVENGGHDVLEAHPDIPGLLVRFFKGEPAADVRLSLPPPKFLTV